MKHTLIGISGPMGSGKDTFADMLRYASASYAMMQSGYSGNLRNMKDMEDWLTNRHDLNSRWEIKKYADTLKQIAGLMLNMHPDQFNSQKLKQKELPPEWQVPGEKRTFRWFLQVLGTDAIRKNIHPNAWILSLFSGYYINSQWIITDVRFPNEADAILERGGLLIRINRNGIPTSDHPSETALNDYDRFDITINNDGTLEDLLYMAFNIYENFIAS